jgi:lysozyme
MQGIDISNWQRGIDLSRVPCDFVIVKSTEGMTYVDPCCDGFVQQAIGLGKLWGFYHYVTGGDPEAEADFWVRQTSGYFRAGIPCVDWESGGNRAWGDVDYLRRFVQRVIDKTGVKPLIYASATSFPWGVCDELDCGAWVAQYASNNTTGYQDHPWNEGAYDCVIRQYSSAGRLAGYNGNLDLDKAYMTKEQWARYADPDGTPDTTSESEEEDMADFGVIFNPGDATKDNGVSGLYWMVGGRLYHFNNADQPRALDMMCNAVNGHDVPRYEFEGSDPWADRLAQACGGWDSAIECPHFDTD